MQGCHGRCRSSYAELESAWHQRWGRLGKTYLLHAGGQRFLERNPGAQVRHTTSELLINEMIRAIRYEPMLSFRRRHRCVDLLLLDDIQLFAGLEKS
jgi:chromosomal replication initiator protein